MLRVVLHRIRELMSAADVGRTVSRIAHQIIEKTALDGADAPRVVLLGIPTRGVTLANRLAANIGEFSGVDGRPRRPGHHALPRRPDVKPPRPLEDTSIPAGGIDDALVILVDDVLYSGRSVRSALDALRDIGRPQAVQLAVLVDRGHRELPLRADYVGKNVPTSRSESVHVRLARTTVVEGVVISRGGRAMTRHLLAAGDLTRDEATAILDDADRFAQALVGREVKKLPTLRGRTIITMFYENSTRTRVSFEVAGKWMSADVINVSASGSSVAKGESLRDTALTLRAAGADALIIRHPASGAAQQLAEWTLRADGAGPSVINAGDGTHEHPTQALLDALTMRQRLGDIEGRRVVIVGDILHSRVARSNVMLLATLGAEVVLVAPPTLLPVGVADWPVTVSHDLDAELPAADAVLMLRVQAERMNGGFFPSAREYSVLLRAVRPAPGDASRPRGGAASRPDAARHGDLVSVADSSQSAVLQQVSNGVHVRMAVLFHLLVGTDEAVTVMRAAA